MATLTVPVATVDKSADSSQTVVFRGDGEPKTPELMVRRLARINESSGIEADNYSLGGVVEEVEKRFAAILGKEAAVFHTDRHARKPPRYPQPDAGANRAPLSRNRATSITT